MTIVLSIVLLAMGIFLIWRVLKLAPKYKLIEDPPAEVGDINVREPVPQRPKGKVGAVALEEPLDDTATDACSRR